MERLSQETVCPCANGNHPAVGVIQRGNDYNRSGAESRVLSQHSAQLKPGRRWQIWRSTIWSRIFPATPCPAKFRKARPPANADFGLISRPMPAQRRLSKDTPSARPPRPRQFGQVILEARQYIGFRPPCVHAIDRGPPHRGPQIGS